MKHDKGEAGKDGLSVKVFGNNVDKAIKVLKKKVMDDGILRECRQRQAYEKPGDKKRRAKAEAVRRWAKKMAQLKENNEF